MTIRTDNDGEWTSLDDGATWALTTPSAEWLAAREAIPPTEWTDPPADTTAHVLEVLSDAFTDHLSAAGTLTMAKLRDAFTGAIDDAIQAAT